MQELKERIQKEGKVLPGNIVKVDGFLNHRVDCQLMGRMADEFARIFDISKVDLILTAEASGIALAAVCAEKGFQGGGDRLRGMGLNYHALAVIEKADENGIIFREEG